MKALREYPLHSKCSSFPSFSYHPNREKKKKKRKRKSRSTDEKNTEKQKRGMGWVITAVAKWAWRVGSVTAWVERHGSMWWALWRQDQHGEYEMRVRHERVIEIEMTKLQMRQLEILFLLLRVFKHSFSYLFIYFFVLIYIYIYSARPTMEFANATIGPFHFFFKYILCRKILLFFFCVLHLQTPLQTPFIFFLFFFFYFVLGL